MDGKEILKKMILSYPLIYGGAMMATWLCVIIYDPDAIFGADYFGWMFLVVLVGDLSMLIFYSKKRLTKQQWNARTIIHAIALVLIMLGAGYVMEFYENLKEGIVFTVTVVGVYLMVIASNFASDFIEANRINEELKKMKK